MTLTPAQRYTKVLDRLAALLRREPMTARQIAEELKCCRPAAYQRLAALKKRGERIFTMPIRESVTGPGSTAYVIR